MRKLFRREVILTAYSAESRENARRAQDDLFGIQNSRKARLGMLAGLQDPAIMDRKQAEEAEAPPGRAGERIEIQGTHRRSVVRCGRGPEDLGRHLLRLGPLGERRRLQQQALRHRPDARPPGRRIRGAERPAAPRVPRIEPRIAQVRAVLRGPDLRGHGDGDARRLADHAGGDERHGRPAGPEDPGGQVAAGAGRPADRGHEAQERRTPQEAGRGRPGGPPQVGGLR